MRAFIPAIDLPVSQEVLVQAEEAVGHLIASFETLVQARRAAPQADLISVLARTQDRQGHHHLSTAELVDLCITLMVAGHESTANLIGDGVLTFLQHPELIDRYLSCADQENAVEELMRFVSPTKFNIRTTGERPVTIEHCQIPPYSWVLLLRAWANRDPQVFPEPHTLDFGRTNLAKQHRLRVKSEHFVSRFPTW